MPTYEIQVRITGGIIREVNAGTLPQETFDRICTDNGIEHEEDMTSRFWRSWEQDEPTHSWNEINDLFSAFGVDADHVFEIDISLVDSKGATIDHLKIDTYYETIDDYLTTNRDKVLPFYNSVSLMPKSNKVIIVACEDQDGDGLCQTNSFEFESDQIPVLHKKNIRFDVFELKYYDETIRILGGFRFLPYVQSILTIEEQTDPMYDAPLYFIR